MAEFSMVMRTTTARLLSFLKQSMMSPYANVILSVSEMLTLPADVLFLICEELSVREDFTGLFNCALTSKSLAGSALLWLYRIQNQAPILGSELDSNDADQKSTTIQSRVNARNKTFLKWALQWKSIIRSSLANTAYPYCLYIRSLDLRSLRDLLEDPTFRETAHDTFFADDMAVFLKSQETPMKQKMRGAKPAYRRLDVTKVLELVGESITRFISDSASQNRTTVAVEDLAGQIPAGSLSIWASRLSKLKSLTLWDGSMLNASVGSVIAKHCFSFDDLTIFACFNGEHDRELASFFTALRRDTLRSFVALNAAAVGPETLLSLNHHSKTLKKLSLDGLTSDALKKLSSVQECVTLENLLIGGADRFFDLEATENDVYLEVITWLTRCSSLRDLSLKKLVNGPAILSQICLNNNVRLRKLEVTGYPLAGSQDFHKSLTHQITLESLHLRADAEGGFRDDIDTLVASIARLTNLKYLDIVSTSEFFRTFEILTLVTHLTNLEDFSFGGDVTDNVWYGLANLRNLRALMVHAFSSFSFDGILAYISSLHDTNQGLQLSILNQKTEDALTDQEQQIIKEAIVAKVNGKFDFMLYKDPGGWESDELSD